MIMPPSDEKAIFNAARQLGSPEAQRDFIEQASQKVHDKWVHKIAKDLEVIYANPILYKVGRDDVVPHPGRRRVA